MSSIAISSLNEGLDFACHLISQDVDRTSRASPDKSTDLIAALTQYITFRYVGELDLAFESLEHLWSLCEHQTFGEQQIIEQIEWIRSNYFKA